MRDFFRFNLGHVAIICVWLASFSFGYGTLSTRVTNNEGRIEKNDKRMERLEAMISSMVEKNELDKAVNAAQLAAINAQLATVVNDVAWIKRNIK